MLGAMTVKLSDLAGAITGWVVAVLILVAAVIALVGLVRGWLGRRRPQVVIHDVELDEGVPAQAGAGLSRRRSADEGGRGFGTHDLGLDGCPVGRPARRRPERGGRTSCRAGSRPSQPARLEHKCIPYHPRLGCRRPGRAHCRSGPFW